jgi:hypothetical protein
MSPISASVNEESARRRRRDALVLGLVRDVVGGDLHDHRLAQRAQGRHGLCTTLAKPSLRAADA